MSPRIMNIKSVFRKNEDFRPTNEDLHYTFKELQDINYALNQNYIVAITDQYGTIIYANDHFCKISKYTREELIGQDHRILNSGTHSKSFFREFWRTIQSGQIWQGEICNRAKDGSLYWVNATIVPLLDQNGKPYQYVAIRTEITAMKQAQETIRYMAYHDDLTRLPNRRLFKETLQHELDIARWTKKKIALLFLDIDRFKNLNDTLGHSVGDLFLQKVAERLQKLHFIETNLFRVGGDEFIILFPNIREVLQVEDYTKQIIAAFDQSFMIGEHELFASVSIGISIYPEHGEDIDTLVKHADVAMYRAKEIGESSHRYYQVNMDNGTEGFLYLETRLRKALEENLLTLHYQPKVDMKTGEISGIEALIRWQDSVLDMVSPQKFIPLAEERGLINQIGEWTLKEACRQNKAWQEAGLPPVRVAVNISAIQFQRANFLKKIMEVLDETQLEPKYLEIEITENTLMKDTKQILNKLIDLKKMGITVAIDDFGTGFSSLSYLKSFPVDILKIDRSFVKDLACEEEGVAMISSIIHLAHGLKMRVVAEGVEEEAQLNILREHSCDEIQGYYYSRPKPAAEMEQLLQTWSPSK